MDNVSNPNRLSLAIVRFLILVAIGVFVGYQIRQQEVADLKDPQVRLEVAQRALADGDDATAYALFSKLAEDGNARAQYWLADMYEYGYGVKKDAAKALSWMEKAAAQGSATAQARLGAIYLTGQDAPQDFKAARSWLQKAADQQNAVAERRLGQMEDQGLGGPADPVGAYVLYERAVLHGDAYAVRLRDELLKRMSPAQITEAQALVEKLSKR